MRRSGEERRGAVIKLVYLDLSLGQSRGSCVAAGKLLNLPLLWFAQLYKINIAVIPSSQDTRSNNEMFKGPRTVPAPRKYS